MGTFSHLAAAITASILLLMIEILPNAPLFNFGVVLVLAVVFIVTYAISAISAPLLNTLFRFKSNILSGLGFSAGGFFWGTALTVFSKQGYFNRPETLWRDITQDAPQFLATNWEFPVIGAVSALAAYWIRLHENKNR